MMMELSGERWKERERREMGWGSPVIFESADYGQSRHGDES